ncbi:retrovirus-related pol polyprotein from transposon TNT 1-94 [Tanacetum coccineum]
MSVKTPTYINLESSSKEHKNEKTPSPPPRKKSLSSPHAPSKSTSRRSTHYTSSSSPTQELPPLQISQNDPYVATMDNLLPGLSNPSPPPHVSRPPPGFPHPPSRFEIPQPPHVTLVIWAVFHLFTFSDNGKEWRIACNATSIFGLLWIKRLRKMCHIEGELTCVDIVWKLLVLQGGSPAGIHGLFSGRHMTGNKDFPTDYQDINGGFVVFGGSARGGVIMDRNSKNKELDELCGLKGIKREFSIVRTLQQNRVAERKNRTLIEASRTMLANSLVSIVFWAEAVNTACYVLNRVLVTKPHKKTPYELIIGRPPSISFMRPFGCPVTLSKYPRPFFREI